MIAQLSPTLEPELERHVLVVDDSPSIHEDFRKILNDAPANAELQDLESRLFGSASQSGQSGAPHFVLDTAYQGAEGLAKVQRANAAGTPYCVIFVDVRMPPGWDGIETLERIFAVDSATQVVLCTAYSDHSWSELRERFGNTDRLLVLRKPFEPIEVVQLAFALSQKWHRERQLAKLTEALRLSEQRARALLDAVPDVLFRIDRASNVVQHRPGLAGAAGTEAGPRLDLLCTASQQATILALARQSLETGASRSAVVEPDRDSSGSYYHVHISPLDDLEAVVLLRDVTALRQAERSDAQRRVRELALEMKIEALAKLATPVIPVRQGVLVMPLVGEMDSRRAQRLRETMLDQLVAQRATLIILDLTGLPSLDEAVATELTRAAQATRLLGARMVLCGLSAQAARQVVTLGLRFDDVRIVRSLETAIGWALRQ